MTLTQAIAEGRRFGARAGRRLGRRIERLTGRSMPSIQTLLEWAARLGYGARGFVYFNVGLVALLAALDLTGDSLGAGGIIELTAQQPFGRVWLTLLGVGNIIKGVTGEFADSLSCDRDICRRVVPLARAGYAARGFAYLPMGMFVVLAGWRTRAEEARSFGASLELLEAQPFGSWIVGFTAVGIMAFGAFALVEARWRRIRMPREIKPR